MEDVVRRAHEAMRAQNWDDLRLLLHPYLHWALGRFGLFYA